MVNIKDKEPNINNYKCDYYEKDMGICGYGFGDCGTDGKYSYDAECGTVCFKSLKYEKDLAEYLKII